MHSGARLPQHPVTQGLVIVVATQGRVTACGHHFKHTLRETKDGDVEGASPQVEHGVQAFAAIVEAIGNRRSRGLVQQAQQVQASELGRVFGGLALGVVEIGGHRDHSAKDVVVKRILGPEPQRGQDFGAHLHGRFGARNGLDAQHARSRISAARHQPVGQLLRVGNVGQPAPHEALD